MITLMRSLPSRAARGSTILEFLIYIAVVGLALTVAVSFLSEFSSSQQKTAAQTNATHNARFAVSRIASDIRDAMAVDGTTAFASDFVATPANILSLDMSAPALDPTVYTVSDGRLYVQQGAGSPIALTSSSTEVTSFVLSNVSVSGKTRAVRIHLTLENRNTTNLNEQEAVVTIETTARLPRLDGFGS